MLYNRSNNTNNTAYSDKNVLSSFVHTQYIAPIFYRNTLLGSPFLTVTLTCDCLQFHLKTSLLNLLNKGKEIYVHCSLYMYLLDILLRFKLCLENQKVVYFFLHFMD